MFFANGDSHTIGSELEEKKAYAFSLSRKLNFNSIKNIALGGASNDRIIRTTNNYLQYCDFKKIYPKFILIGWSNYNRQDWFYNGEYRSIPATSDWEDINEKHVERFYYSRTIFKEIDKIFMAKFIKYFQERIYNLHCELNYRKIPHLFLNTCACYANKADLNDLKQYDWKNRFWNPYEINGSFCDWGLSKNYKETKFHHMEQKCHDDFTIVLYDYIMKYDLLSCPTDN